MFEILAKHHHRLDFDCGNDNINRYLSQFANQHNQKGIAKIHVLADGDIIKGFFTLSATNLDNTQGLIKGYPHQIPVVLIGRMGVATTYQGQKLSGILLSEALHQIKQASQTIGIAFAMIDAKNDALADYYERLGFIRLSGSLRLIYPVSQI